MAWLRLYDTTLDNRKVQTLPPVLFKALVNLWCVAKRYGGFIPSVADAAYSMRSSEKDVASWIDQLVDRKLIDKADDGSFQPHDWDEHQFVSDNVAARVKKHRQKRRGNVSGNDDGNGDGNADETLQRPLHVTPKKAPEQRQNRTEAESEQSPPHPKPPPAPKLGKRDHWPENAVVPELWLRTAEAERRRLGLPPVDIEVVAAKFVHWHSARQHQPRTRAEWQGCWNSFVLDEKAGKSNGSGQQSGQSGRGSAGGTLDAIAREIAELEGVRRE